MTNNTTDNKKSRRINRIIALSVLAVCSLSLFVLSCIPGQPLGCACIPGCTPGSEGDILKFMGNPVMIVIMFFAFLYFMYKGRKGGG